jgi:hypothetical protein
MLGYLAYIHDFLFNPFILANQRAGNIEKISQEKRADIFSLSEAPINI